MENRRWFPEKSWRVKKYKHFSSAELQSGNFSLSRLHYTYTTMKILRKWKNTSELFLLQRSETEFSLTIYIFIHSTPTHKITLFFFTLSLARKYFLNHPYSLRKHHLQNLLVYMKKKSIEWLFLLKGIKRLLFGASRCKVLCVCPNDIIFVAFICGHKCKLNFLVYIPRIYATIKQSEI